jgi:hypothetical protein
MQMQMRRGGTIAGRSDGAERGEQGRFGRSLRARRKKDVEFAVYRPARTM